MDSGKVVRSGNPAVACLYLRRLTLIRPDQLIAWTGDVWPACDAFDVLAMATGQQSQAFFNDTPDHHHQETVHESSS